MTAEVFSVQWCLCCFHYTIPSYYKRSGLTVGFMPWERGRRQRMLGSNPLSSSISHLFALEPTRHPLSSGYVQALQSKSSCWVNISIFNFGVPSQKICCVLHYDDWFVCTRSSRPACYVCLCINQYFICRRSTFCGGHSHITQDSVSTSVAVPCRRTQLSRRHDINMKPDIVICIAGGCSL